MFILLFFQGPTVPLGYNQRFFSRDLDHYHTSQRPSTGTNFRRSRSTEWDREGQERRRGVGGGEEGEGERGRKEGELRRGNIERGGGAFHMNTASRYILKTNINLIRTKTVAKSKAFYLLTPL